MAPPVMNGVAWITGASSGIGKALAVRFAADGWAVGLSARRTEALEAVALECKRVGGRAVVCPCDVADLGQVRSAARRVLEAFGHKHVRTPRFLVELELAAKVPREKRI